MTVIALGPGLAVHTSLGDGVGYIALGQGVGYTGLEGDVLAILHQTIIFYMSINNK